MKFASFDRLGVSPARIACLSALASAGGTSLTWTVTGGAVGGARGAVAGAVGAMVFYFVMTVPRRLADAQRLAEARETPLLSASAAACLAVTGSRPRTIVLMNPRDPVLRASLSEAGRRILLGSRVDRALEIASSPLVSYTAVAAFRGLAAFTPEGVEQSDEEVQGLAMSQDLTWETKVPMLMTVCFFTPILLILYALFSHTYGAASLAELAALEFIVLDLAFFLSSAERNRR